MHLIKLLLTLLLLSSLAHASDLYIKLGATTSVAQVQQIENILKQKGYQLHIQEEDERYKVYAGAFASQSQALQALQTLQKIFPSAVAVRLRSQTFTQAPKETPQNTQTSNTDHTKKAPTSGERPFFVQLALGFHNTDGKKSGEAEALEPSASGMSYGVGFGYMFSDAYWASIGYDILGTGDVSLNNIYTSLNYNFVHNQNLSAYMGVLVGYSTLSWDSAPQENASTSGPSSFFAGAQVGLNYPFGLEGLSLISTYSLTSFNLKTNLTAEEGQSPSAIEHTLTHKISVGLQYNF